MLKTSTENGIPEYRYPKIYIELYENYKFQILFATFYIIFFKYGETR
jgi:hypothetical protein